jgi:hypothetical protein
MRVLQKIKNRCKAQDCSKKTKQSHSTPISEQACTLQNRYLAVCVSEFRRTEIAEIAPALFKADRLDSNIFSLLVSNILDTTRKINARSISSSRNTGKIRSISRQILDNRKRDRSAIERSRIQHNWDRQSTRASHLYILRLYSQVQDC